MKSVPPEPEGTGEPVMDRRKKDRRRTPKAESEQGRKPLKKGEKTVSMMVKVPESFKKMVKKRTRELGFESLSAYVRYALGTEVEDLKGEELLQLLIRSKNKLEDENKFLKEGIRYKWKSKKDKERALTIMNSDDDDYDELDYESLPGAG